MKTIILFTFFLLACQTAEDKGHFESVENTLVFDKKENRLILNEVPFSINIETIYQLSEEAENTFYFKHAENKTNYLHFKLIDQKASEFSDNLTRLSKTYEHLLDKFVAVSENIDRIEDRKAYQLVFGFKDKDNNEHINIVQCIQVSENKLLTLTSSSMIRDKKENYRIVNSTINSIKFKH